MKPITKILFGTFFTISTFAIGGGIVFSLIHFPFIKWGWNLLHLIWAIPIILGVIQITFAIVFSFIHSIMDL